MKETIINNNTQNNTTTLPHFWRNATNTWRTTNTGMNKNTLLILTPIKDRKLYTPSFDNLNFQDKKKLKYSAEIINDCLISIYNGEVGYVFTKDQLKEVKKILPRVEIKRDVVCDCYSCWK